jgi:hypothetical protein
MLGIASEKLHYGYGIINQAGNRLLGDAQLMERQARCDAFLKETIMEVLLRMLEISEKLKKAKTMSRIYLSDNYEYQEVAGPLDEALELLWDFLGKE